MYVVRSKSFQPDIQKPRQMENAVRDIQDIYIYIYLLIHGCEKCVEIKGDYVEKQQRCFISVTLKSWSDRNLLYPTTYLSFAMHVPVDGRNMQEEYGVYNILSCTYVYLLLSVYLNRLKSKLRNLTAPKQLRLTQISPRFDHLTTLQPFSHMQYRIAICVGLPVMNRCRRSCMSSHSFCCCSSINVVMRGWGKALGLIPGTRETRYSLTSYHNRDFALRARILKRMILRIYPLVPRG